MAINLPSIAPMVAGAAAGLFALGNMKFSRPDGTFKKVHKYRRMMFHIMPTRNESIVFFDREIRAEKLEAYLAEAKEAFGANMTHITVAAINVAIAENPAMNQFVVGRRMYDRKGRWITFSMKRKKLNQKAKLSAVKLLMKDGETFRELTERINGQINVERSGVKTAADKEFDLLDRLPRPGMNLMNSLLRFLDYHNLLPGFFIEADGMYTSAFVANLGSVGMGPGYHHLYEHGTCPLFLMIGKVDDKPVIEDGKVVPGRVLHVRFSYDERIADGLTANGGIEAMVRQLEDPYKWFGCLKDDGSDARAMFMPGQELGAEG